MNADDFNRRMAAAADDIERYVATLERSYSGAIGGAGRHAARTFGSLVAAANWTPPQAELVDRQRLADRARARTRKTHERALTVVVEDTLTTVGIVWDITHPLAQSLLDQLGVRADDIADGLREPVARAIIDAYTEGLSVPDTAKRIVSAVDDVKGWQATMLARNDLISLANGGSLTASRLVHAKTGKLGHKQWLSAGDGQVRPSHVAASGQQVPLDQPFQVGGFPMLYPGDPSAPHAEVVNCRCTQIYVDAPAAVAASGEGLHSGGEMSAEVGEATVKIRPDMSDFGLAARASWTDGHEPESWTDGHEPITAATITIETDDDATETADAVPVAWVSDVAFEGMSTGDGRWIAPEALGHREPPLTLMAMIETTSGGHEGALIAGRMDSFERDAEQNMLGEPLPEGVAAWRSFGMFDTGGEFGADVGRMVGDETLRGISVDLSIEEWAFRDPDTGALLDPDEMSEDDWMRAFMGELEFAILAGTILAATVCPTPAFADARIALAASATRWPGVWQTDDGLVATLWQPFHMVETGVTAAAVTIRPNADATGWTFTDSDGREVSGLFPPDVLTAAVETPERPPRAWFDEPVLEGPTPITITDDGRVYGHMALWDSCHVGEPSGPGVCVTPPSSASQYAHFHLGEIETDDGERISVGKITVGTGHADLRAGLKAATDHYDNTGSVAAYVRAYEDTWGIAVAGTVNPDADDSALRALMANPPSGDWRRRDGSLEMVAVLSVPVPGFPVPRPQAVVAGMESGFVDVVTLVAAGAFAEPPRHPMSDEEFAIRTGALAELAGVE